MGEAGRSPNLGRPSFQLHELGLFALGTVTTTALVLASRGLNRVILEVIGCTFLYSSIILVYQGAGKGLRVRFLASYGFVVWFYFAIARVIPALKTKLRDGELLALDEGIFGKTPSVYLEQAATPWLTDLMSLCYMMYLLYLSLAVVHAALVGDSPSKRLSVYLFTGFTLGFAGYLLVPAVGPVHAYPEIFQQPLPGGALTRLGNKAVTVGSSVYDVFPSLHILITCILLDHDWRHIRRRFWVMAVPSLVMALSTVYLRYHYGADILAGFLVFLALRQTFLKVWSREERVRL